MLQRGENVRFHTLKGEWKFGTVTNKIQNVSRSYNVKASDGKVYRRNRRQIFNTKEKHGEIPRTVPDINIEHKPADMVPIVTNVKPPSVVDKDTPVSNQCDQSQGYAESPKVYATVVTRSVSRPPQRLDL